MSKASGYNQICQPLTDYNSNEYVTLNEQINDKAQNYSKAIIDKYFAESDGRKPIGYLYKCDYGNVNKPIIILLAIVSIASSSDYVNIIRVKENNGDIVDNQTCVIRPTSAYDLFSTTCSFAGVKIIKFNFARKLRETHQSLAERAKPFSLDEHYLI